MLEFTYCKVLLLITMFPISCLGQDILPEQLALDFYCENILEIKNGQSVYYDESIQEIDSSYQELGQFILERYYYCKRLKRGLNNTEIIIDDGIYERELKAVREYDFQRSLDQQVRLLNGRRPLKKRRNLKYTDLTRTRLGFVFEEIWHSIFPEKFNLVIEPAVHYEGDSYVLLRVNKRDFECWYFYIIVLRASGEVKDWCEEYWVQ